MLNNPNQLLRISEGNPGVMRLCLEIQHRDPQLLDVAEKNHLTGSNLWMCYNDTCEENMQKLIDYLTNK